MSSELEADPSQLIEDGGKEITQEQLLVIVAEAQSARTRAEESEIKAKEVVQQLGALLAQAQDLLGKITETVPTLASKVAEVEASQSSAATLSKQVGEAQTRATEIRGDLEKILATAQQSQAEVEGLKQSVDSTKASASQADADILGIKATVDSNAQAIKTALETANTSTAITKGLADIAANVDQRIKDYETKLEALNSQCSEQLEAIKSLLPGATSAGLAAAFDDRRRTFLDPSKRWQRVFFASIVLLIGLASWSLYEVYLRASTMPNSQIVVLWLSRLPVAAALVWLAMHASRESALAKRLEEDYGFKVSVASSFQGFQEQMKNVGSVAADNEPLKTLCDATLAQIMNPPGRIYERHALAVSPTSELLKVAQPVVDMAKTTKLPGAH